jgi:hypothetical protein
MSLASKTHRLLRGYIAFPCKSLEIHTQATNTRAGMCDPYASTQISDIFFVRRTYIYVADVFTKIEMTVQPCVSTSCAKISLLLVRRDLRYIRLVFTHRANNA